MDWYTKINEWFNAGVWTVEMVKNAVNIGKITEEQFQEILKNNVIF